MSLHHPHGDERAHHEDVEVGEVDELDDAVDHGEPEREKRIHRAQAHPVDHLLKQDIPRIHAQDSRLQRRNAQHCSRLRRRSDVRSADA